VSGSKDKTIKQWDLQALKKPVCANACKSGSRCTGSASSGGGSGGSTLAEVQPRAVATAVAHKKDINALAVSPNDRMVVSGSQDRLLKVWRLEDTRMTEAASLSGHRRGVWSVAFSPIEKVAASGSGDMTVKVWSMADWNCLRTFEGHESSVLKVRFVCRGTMLASSSSDGLIKVWTIKSGECASTLDGHSDKVWALDMLESDSGIELLSGSADSTMVRWRDSTAAAEASRAVEEEQRLQQEEQLSIAMSSRQLDKALEAAPCAGFSRRCTQRRRMTSGCSTLLG